MSNPLAGGREGCIPAYVTNLRLSALHAALDRRTLEYIAPP